MKQAEMTGNRSLAEEVTRILRNRILHGEYEMGEKLTESKIAEELKVSRTPVRDAFRQLSKEQLIEYVPNKGCFATGFSREDMADIYRVRRAVEELAIRQVIAHADDKSVQRLEKQLEKMLRYTETNDYDRLLEANEDFHNMIYGMTQSRFIVQIMKTFQDYVHLAREESLSREPDLKVIYEEHEALYRAIVARDEEMAIRATREHLENSAKRALLRWEY